MRTSRRKGANKGRRENIDGFRIFFIINSL